MNLFGIKLYHINFIFNDGFPDNKIVFTLELPGSRTNQTLLIKMSDTSSSRYATLQA